MVLILGSKSSETASLFFCNRGKTRAAVGIGKARENWSPCQDSFQSSFSFQWRSQTNGPLKKDAHKKTLFFNCLSRCSSIILECYCRRWKKCPLVHRIKGLALWTIQSLLHPGMCCAKSVFLWSLENKLSFFSFKAFLFFINYVLSFLVK